MVPEEIPLRERVSQVRLADTLDLLNQRRVFRHRLAKRFPIRAAPARDDVVDGRQRVVLRIDMPVDHGVIEPYKTLKV